MTSIWTKKANFYHLYPLGCTGAPTQNQSNQTTSYRLETLLPWLDHIKGLGMNSLYLGPVFQSTSHGYDTMDFFKVDQRLGDNDSLTLSKPASGPSTIISNSLSIGSSLLW